MCFSDSCEKGLFSKYVGFYRKSHISELMFLWKLDSTGHSPAGASPVGALTGGWIPPVSEPEALTGGEVSASGMGDTPCRSGGRQPPEVPDTDVTHRRMSDTDVGWWRDRMPTCPTVLMAEESAGRWRDSG